MSGQFGARLAALQAVVVLRLVATAVVAASGFHAVSDDDFARIALAQGFAHAPRLDPTGTSWLPAPFWLMGSWLALLGTSFEAARAVAFAQGVGAALLLYAAARALGFVRTHAVLAVAVACATPYFAWMGLAAGPEALAASAAVYGAAALGGSRWERWLAVGALGFATLSRYEHWPIAAVSALSVLLFERREVRLAERGLLALALLAGPLSWLAHGVVNHGDAWFFVKRVAAYRQAIGASPTHLLEALTAFPLRVLRCEPELVGATLVSAVAWSTLARRRPAAQRRPSARVLLTTLAVLSVLPFLVLGDVRDGAPTHHSERAVLPVWLLFTLLLASVPSWLPANAWRPYALATVLAVGAGVYPARPWLARIDDFVDRRAEVALGADARRLGAQRLLVATKDYGYFAVMVGAGGPQRSAPFDDRDPRVARPPNPFTNAAALSARLDGERTGWFVTSTSDDAIVAAQVAEERARRGGLRLWERRQ